MSVNLSMGANTIDVNCLQPVSSNSSILVEIYQPKYNIQYGNKGYQR